MIIIKPPFHCVKFTPNEWRIFDSNKLNVGIIIRQKQRKWYKRIFGYKECFVWRDLYSTTKMRDTLESATKEFIDNMAKYCDGEIHGK